MPKKIGILGGGQLAQMMISRALEMGLKPWVYSSHKEDPAQQICPNRVLGPMDHSKKIKAFLDKVDAATFESEFLDATLLEKLDTDNKLSPKPATMGLFQDRLTQKQFLDDHKVPTTPWKKVSTADELNEAMNHLGLPLVLKKRHGGYDGYGTFILKNKAQVKKFKETQLSANKTGFIAEAWVPFQRELALLFVRDKSGQVQTYPLVESFQKDSRCFWVKGPVKHAKISTLTRPFKKALNQQNYVGVIAMEIFDRGSSLYVNELAPRVHNSGHYSQNAGSMSQFEAHVRTLLEEPLPTIRVEESGFSMVNLLGPDQAIKNLSPQLHGEGQLHWYGKKDSRPGRKMGHINTQSSTPNKALNKALKSLKEFYYE